MRRFFSALLVLALALSLAACAGPSTTSQPPSGAPETQAVSEPPEGETTETPEQTEEPEPTTAQYFLATGRWDNTVIVIDLEKAIDPANDATENAVVNRLRVTADIDPDGDGTTEPASGQPIYITINQDAMRAYVTNHSGSVSAAQTGSYETGWEIGESVLSSVGQHGQPATVAVVDLEKALDPANWDTLGAVEEIFDTTGFGATGTAVAPDGKYLALAHAEAEGSEDGGYHIYIVDLATNKIIEEIELACSDTIPNPNATLSAPDTRFGYFPCPNGVTFSSLGGGTLFTANGGTLDVSVIDWTKAMAGDPDAEVARIPTQTGGFGLSASPDGKYVVVAAREDPRDESEGNTVSLIDVEKALSDPENAEISRILVGTEDPDEASRPFVATFTPDGSQIVATCFRTNCISVIDTAEAALGGDVTVKNILLEMPDGEKPSRPRGIAFSADGAYAAVSGAPTKGEPGSGVVWILETKDWTVKGRVTGIGNETYMIGGFIG